MNIAKKIYTTTITLAMATVLTTATAQEAGTYDTHVLPEALIIEPLNELGMKTRVDLILRGPEGFYQRQRFDAGELIEFDPSTVTSEAMPDGVYRYEVRIMDVAGMQSNRETGEIHSVDPALQDIYGAFSIKNGQIVDPNIEEAPGKKSSQGLTSKGGSTNAQPGQSTRQLIAENLYVDGKACIGTNCVDNESLGSDTLRLKEDNVRIKFEDTSNSSSFPTNDWELTANDSTDGGANRFSILDVDAGRRIFTVEAGAPSNSLYVENNGDVGFGTSTPVVDGHFVDGASPALRLEQDGSSGFTPQTWDLAGNETNFFIRDVSNGSQLPFRIRPGAPTSAIDISSNGNVGIGTASPAEQLHIRATDGTAKALLEETQAIATNSMFTMRNNGNPGFLLENTDQGTAWQFRLGGSGSTEQFTINKTSQSGPELSVLANGDVRIKGSYLSGSSRKLKGDISRIERDDVLEKLSVLPLYEWSYNTSPNARHIGPMAEEYHELFKLAGGGKSLAATDLASIALAGTKALNERAKGLEQTAKRLEEENQQLNERLKALEAALAHR